MLIIRIVGALEKSCRWPLWLFVIGHSSGHAVITHTLCISYAVLVPSCSCHKFER